MASDGNRRGYALERRFNAVWQRVATMKRERGGGGLKSKKGKEGSFARWWFISQVSETS